jgi:hypothetical protein
MLVDDRFYQSTVFDKDKFGKLTEVMCMAIAKANTKQPVKKVLMIIR